MNVERLVAPAKLTVSLRITGVRADGYHLIDAVMTTLALHDEITVEAITAEAITAEEITVAADRNVTELEFDGPFSDGIPTDSTNLVARALHLCGRHARVRVTKNIPHGGGLGGGSADAAAVLRWAGFDDLEAASRIGADIPFCMVGGRARVTGIGEIIEPMGRDPRDYTLIIPPLSVSTPRVYAAWDELGGPRCDRDRNPNDLESAAMVVEPELRRWKNRIEDALGTEPILAGSGATWFVEGRHSASASTLPGARVVETTGF
ncbi:MAG: 4-(cytidine 5'-diphospho)-2-C-methyl-D-erythritol kinase [Ilumatobacteraceae bacterium]